MERRVGGGTCGGGELRGGKRGERRQRRRVDGQRVGAAAQLQHGGCGDVGDGRRQRGVARALTAAVEGREGRYTEMMA